MMVLSGTGLIANGQEVGVNYAPPSFIGPEVETAGGAAAPAASAGGAEAEGPTELPVEDPLAEALAAIRGEAPKSGTGGTPSADSASVDPLADVMADIRAKGSKAEAVEARATTLPFGGDKWGRDVLKKVIKGSETSIFVGLAAAVVATFLGTLFGAIAGYYGRWLDDIFNWFYSVFTSIPYLLLILAVAAVLRRERRPSSILGLTGWTSCFRLIRGEYLSTRGVNTSGGGRDRRVERTADVRAYLSEHQPRRAGAAIDPGGRVHQVRGHPFLPGFRRSGRCRVVGIDAQRSTKRADTGQVVAARRSGHGDGLAGHRVQPFHRCAARCARSEVEVMQLMRRN
jgi:hypothetical protein